MRRVDRINRINVEMTEKWDEYSSSMPFTEIRTGYKIQVAPPTGGAIMRFRILAPDDIEYSIYFDASDALGIVGAPYYELYPFYPPDSDDIDGDIKRYSVSEFKDILMDIYVMTEGLDTMKMEIPEYFV